MKRLIITILILVLITGGITKPTGDVKGNDNEPKPWPQYAGNAAHTSVAFDTWDYEKYDEVAWEMTLKTNRGWNRNPVIGMGMMVIGDTRYVRCVDVISGKQTWSLELSQACTESCTMLGDIVVVPLQERYLGLSMATGEIKWYGSSGDSKMSSISALKKGEEIYGYFSSYSKNGAVYRVRLDPPKSSWRIGNEWAVVGAPGVNDRKGYVGMAGHYKVKLLAEGYGGMKEDYKISTQFWAPTVAFGDHMVFTASGGEIIVLPKPPSASSEQIIDVGAWCFHGPSVYGESLVIGNDSKRLVRFKINGEIIWDVKMPGKVTDAVTVMGDELLVPVASSNPEIAGVYIVSGETGETTKKILFGEGAENVYQPVVAWKRMFVEFGSNEKYRNRKLFCYGQKPRATELEPKLRVKDGRLNVSIPWRGKTTKQVTLINEGKVDLDLLFDGDTFMSASVETLNIPAGQEDTLRVVVSAGNVRPGKYSGKLDIFIMDGEYGRRSLGFVTADITVTEEEEEEPQDEPPNPPTDITATWLYDHVELNWTKPAFGTEVVGYDLYKTEGDEPFSKTPINKTKIKETSTQDTEVTPGKTYKYCVVSVAGGQLYSDPSESVSISIPIKLKAVTNLKAEKNGANIVLLWDSEQEVKFKIECNGEEIGRTSDKTFTHENPPKTQLIYKVFPLWGGKIGPEAYVIVDNKPGEVKPVTELKSQQLGDSVLLVWSHEGGVEFEILRNGTKIGDTSELYFKDNNPPKKKITYEVVAKIGTIRSSGVSIGVNLAPTLIEIRGLNTDVGKSSILLYWQGTQEDVEFVILRNDVEIGRTSEPFFTDDKFETGKLLVYTVYPTRDGEDGTKKTVEVDLRSKKVEVVFTIGKSTARVNGIEMDCKGTPFVSSAGRSMVPFRFLGESIGAKVGYTSSKSGGVKSVSYILGGKIIILTIGSKIADVDGEMVELDAGPMIREGRTYVPLRFVTEALGAKVAWNSMTRSATITIDMAP